MAWKTCLGTSCFTIIITLLSRSVHTPAATLKRSPSTWSTSMPSNPMNPQPPFAEPGKGLPEREIDNPGRAHPEREAEPEPLQPDRDDDLL